MHILCEETYPLLLLQLPQLHVLDALLLVGLLDEGDLLQSLGPLKVVDLDGANHTMFFFFIFPEVVQAALTIQRRGS